MKILITGSGGFIGKNLTEHLKGKYDIESPRSYELDLSDTDQVGDYLKHHQFDIIIHSAKRDNVKYQLSDYEVLDSNLRMFYNLEKYHDEYGRMYYFGSGAEYDRINMKRNVSEEIFGDYIPNDSYGFAKYVMSKEAEKANNIFNLRLFGVFGKYEAWERRFISQTICRAILDLSIIINKNVYFDYLYINDLVKIIEYFIENKPLYKHYNVCRGRTIDLYSLAKIVSDVSGKKLDICIKEKGLQQEYSGNNERLMNELKNFEFESFNTSITELYNYYENHKSEIVKEKLVSK